MRQKSDGMVTPEWLRAVLALLAQTDPHISAYLCLGQVMDISDTEIVIGFTQTQAVAHARCEKHKARIYKAGLAYAHDMNWKFIEREEKTP